MIFLTSRVSREHRFGGGGTVRATAWQRFEQTPCGGQENEVIVFRTETQLRESVAENDCVWR